MITNCFENELIVSVSFLNVNFYIVTKMSKYIPGIMRICHYFLIYYEKNN